MPRSEIIEELKAQLEDHDRLIIIFDEGEDDPQELLIRDVRYNGIDGVIEVRVERDF